MRLIVAIIQPTRLNAVRDALAQAGVTRLTVADALGYARQKGQTAPFRGHEYQANLLRKIALEIVVNEDFVERTLETLTRAAWSGPHGAIGDGKIFVLPLVEAIDISTGERGQGAVN
jgi:nitrogen regulatory protein P-II 1